MKFLLVFLGGGVGAGFRFLITTLMPAVEVKHVFLFPIGTLIVNIVASFVIGIIVGLDILIPVSLETKLLLGTGFCGGLSTFSTFAIENFYMISERNYVLFFINVFLNNFLTLFFAILGYFLGKYLGVINE